MKMLDTNVVIAALNDSPRQVADAISARLHAGDHIAISSVVVFELEYGIARSTRRRENSEQLQRFLAGAVEVIAFEPADATVAGAIRAELESKGTPIGPYDLLIAGQALRHNATLVSANTREFKRVKGLRIEDWTKG